MHDGKTNGEQDNLSYDLFDTCHTIFVQHVRTGVKKRWKKNRLLMDGSGKTVVHGLVCSGGIIV